MTRIKQNLARLEGKRKNDFWKKVKVRVISPLAGSNAAINSILFPQKRECPSLEDYFKLHR